MSQLAQYSDQDEATVVARTLVSVHKSIDENFPALVNRSRQYSKTILSGDEIATPVSSPNTAKIKKSKKDKKSSAERKRTLVSKSESDGEIGSFSHHDGKASQFSQFYEMPKKKNHFLLILSLTFLVAAAIISYILFFKP